MTLNGLNGHFTLNFHYYELPLSCGGWAATYEFLHYIRTLGLCSYTVQRSLLDRTFLVTVM